MRYIPAVKIPGPRECVTVGLGSTLSIANGAVHDTNVCVCPVGIVAAIGPCGQATSLGATISTAVPKINNNSIKKQVQKKKDKTH